MKITNVETVVVNASLRNWVFVKVTTDEPGLVGWGESSLEWKTQAVVGAVNDIAPLVIGEDPRRTEHLWQVMFRQQFFKGGIVTMSAISGIDAAEHPRERRLSRLRSHAAAWTSGLQRSRTRLRPSAACSMCIRSAASARRRKSHRSSAT